MISSFVSLWMSGGLAIFCCLLAYLDEQLAKHGVWRVTISLAKPSDIWCWRRENRCVTVIGRKIRAGVQRSRSQRPCFFLLPLPHIDPTCTRAHHCRSRDFPAVALLLIGRSVPVFNRHRFNDLVSFYSHFGTCTRAHHGRLFRPRHRHC